jgi:hypothetical protein
MKLKRKLVVPMLISLLILLVVVGVASVGAQGISYYVNRWTYAASAGGVSDGASHTVRGTLGQQSVSSSSASNSGLTVTGGIWYGSPAEPEVDTFTLYLPAVFRQFGETSPPFHEVEDAPDDCPGLAVQIGHHYGEDFDATNDNDWWRFTVKAGVTYTLRTLDLGSKADTVLALYADDCTTLLAENDDAQEGTKASYLVWQAPADGEYHVMIRSFDWQNYGPNTAYTFGVSLGRAPLPITPSRAVVPKPSAIPTPTGE